MDSDGQVGRVTWTENNERGVLAILSGASLPEKMFLEELRYLYLLLKKAYCAVIKSVALGRPSRVKLATLLTPNNWHCKWNLHLCFEENCVGQRRDRHNVP